MDTPNLPKKYNLDDTKALLDMIALLVLGAVSLPVIAYAACAVCGG